MLDESRAYAYCKDDISMIENYEQAKNDEREVWVCHHRDGVKILPSGIKVYRTREELKENGRYFHCPANELIFLKVKEHSEIHKKGKQRSEETKKKISNALTGRKAPWNCKPRSEETKKKISESQKGRKALNKGITNSDFGKKFYNEFGITYCEDKLSYKKEYMYYKRNGFCRWEKEER